MGALDIIELTSWAEPIEPAVQARAVEALETGQVLFFPRLDFSLSSAERALLERIGQDEGRGERKNVSFDPSTGRHKGAGLAGEAAAQLEAVMRRYAEAATTLVRGLVPRYAAGLEVARTSFRPTEIAGREMSWRKDDRRLHVDAFPTRPMRGRRILRVFTNADPAETPRRWRVGEEFSAHARRLLPRVAHPLPGSAGVLAMLGLTSGKRSRYDALMLGLHDAAKRDAAYQAEAPAEELAFPAGTTWMVYTDLVPHAALAGRYAFEQTFHIEPAIMADPARAPVRVLENLTGRALI